MNAKFLDKNRPGFNEERGSRDGFLFKLAETYLIAAEAYGRKGNFETAVQRLNVVRQRAAYKDGEAKPSEYWLVEGGDYNDRVKNTETEMLLTVAKLNSILSTTTFVDFMLDERERELSGEIRRWWNLVRSEKLIERVKKYNPTSAPNIKEFHKLRPIPQEHIDRLNPKGPIEEEQNPGYY